MYVWSMDALMLHWQGWVVATENVWPAHLKIFTTWLFRESFLTPDVNHSGAHQVGCYYSHLLAPLNPDLTTHSIGWGWNPTIRFQNPSSFDQMPTGQSPNSLAWIKSTCPACESLRPKTLNPLLVSKHAMHLCTCWSLCEWHLLFTKSPVLLPKSWCI